MDTIQNKIKKAKQKIRRKRFSFLKKKVLLTLQAGIGLGFAYTPTQRLKVLKGFKKEWDFINQQRLKEIINEFYNDRLVEYKENKNGMIQVILAENGKVKALSYNFDTLKIKPQNKWDGFWRIVIFDVPETKKRNRDSFREKLKNLGFYELQKSVFVHPFECREEIDFTVEVLDLRPYVKYGLLKDLTNEIELKSKFQLV